MNKLVTNNDVIAHLQERLKAIDYDRSNVVKALNLLTATELVAQDTAVKRKLTEKRAKKPTAKRKLPPWSPAVNASPYVQVLYDALEDGSTLTTADLLQRVHRAGYHEVTQNQVSGSLSWMRSSGRLTRDRNPVETQARPSSEWEDDLGDREHGQTSPHRGDGISGSCGSEG